jgi:Holliday junction resolvase-like predicted endonuclease/tetrahydromethanopterin S-methyltransferase subunit G
MEAQIQHDSELTFEKVWAMFQETDRKFQETRAEIKESQKVTQKIVSDLGRKFGSVIEYMFIPNLHEKFHQFGYTFGKSSDHILIQDRIHQIFTEVDVLLENGDCAMVVEIKAQPNNNDILDHVERMEKLRQWADLHNDKRKLYGAIAGAIIRDNIRDYILKQGFYVIEQSGDTVNVIAPEGVKVRAW